MTSAMITDTHGRQFKKLRISLTNSCNFACTYCVGNDHAFPKGPQAGGSGQLPLRDLLLIVRALHEQLQLSSIRLTGGEPLLRDGIGSFIKMLGLLGIQDIGLTTNGFLLAAKAQELKEAGLSSINVSLDALDPATFAAMSRRSGLEQVLRGIEAAQQAGIKARINTVVMRGKNDHQILPLLGYAAERGIEIRFLELMAMGAFHQGMGRLFFGQEEILDTVAQQHRFDELEREASSTARYWQTGSGAVFGIIANESSPFCADCNRLRLDSMGNIYGCITNLMGISIKDEAGSRSGLRAKLQAAMNQKQEAKFAGSPVAMMEIGG